MRVIVLIAVSFIFAFANEARKKVYLLEPEISENTVGFEIKPDEYREYYGQIARSLSFIFESNIHKITYEEISRKKNEMATICVFKIFDYYITYGSMGMRNGYLKTMLLVFDSKNAYSYPVQVYLTNSKSVDNWGRNKPLEVAIDSAFVKLGNITKSGNINSIYLHKPLEEIVNCSFECACSSVLLWPDFSEKNIGYQPEKEEIHDFAHQLAYLCSKITGEDVIVVKKEVLDNESECVKNIFEIDLNLIVNTIELSITDNSTKNVIYNCRITLTENIDWNENDEYCKKIKKVFNKIQKDYKKKKKMESKKNKNKKF